MESESQLVVSDLGLQYEETNQQSLKQLAFSWKGYGKIGIIGASRLENLH